MATIAGQCLVSSIIHNCCSPSPNLLYSFFQFEELVCAPEEEFNNGKRINCNSDVVSQELQLGEKKVQGTFIHPDIMSGFRYIVRPADAQKPLFDVRLQFYVFYECV